MAPEIALRECKNLGRPASVLDPMVGSGTVLRYAIEQGHNAIGFDLDPLAVLMARVWTTALDCGRLRRQAALMAEEARDLARTRVELPWIDEDGETLAFVAYWFGGKQRKRLRALAWILHGRRGAAADAMRVALSRLIITKESKASLARDTSHSRPHRVLDTSDFDVIAAFEKSVEWLAKRLEDQAPPGNCSVKVGDARALTEVPDCSVDSIITSPPYLNAIDYIRGHRMSLVWFGHTLHELRTTRAELVGTERGPDGETMETVPELVRSIEPPRGFSRRLHRIAERYADDMVRVMGEMERVLKPGAPATLVIGNSTVEGSFVETAQLIQRAAEMAGLRTTDRQERGIPPSRRYLPPPSADSTSALDGRMRTEVILKLRKPTAA